MHTFEMNDLNVNYFSEKAQCLLVHRDWTRGAYFKTKGEEKYSNIWDWGRCLVIFT